MNFEDLKNPELQERLKACKTQDELVALAKEEGVELSNDQLEAIAGGDGWKCSDHTPCRNHSCGSLRWSRDKLM